MLWSLANERLNRVLNEPSVSVVRFNNSICLLALKISLEFSVNFSVIVVLIIKRSLRSFAKRIV
jgi:hypothetical protein